MRPYQHYRLRDFPDKGDLRHDGRKSVEGVAIVDHATGRAARPWRKRNPNGDYRAATKPKNKKTSRRYLKRRDRSVALRLIEREQ